MLKFRFAERRDYVNNQEDTPTCEHFNSPGHSLADMTVKKKKKVKSSDDLYRKERENTSRSSLLVY